ncbi:MAG: hypothetical protein Q8898_10630 [Bacillota bacterium]|nr:hypothetical protein [Bacillota bacterium]
MKSRLILVEGIPGSGKSTVAGFTEQILKEMNIEAELFSEGNLDHPADYEGVACLSPNQYELMIRDYPFTKNFSKKNRDHYLVFYRKIQVEEGNLLVDQLVNNLIKNDIYELPLTQYMELIAEKWRNFVKMALGNEKTYVFDCCFIQNPVTMSFVKNNAANDEIIKYIQVLEKIIEPLNPFLIYVEQDNIDFSFKKAVAERPSEWFHAFVDYYTSQGFGKENGYVGLDGTLNVLHARKQLEQEIVDRLTLRKTILNNTAFNSEACQCEIKAILTTLIKDVGPTM